MPAVNGIMITKKLNYRRVSMSDMKNNNFRRKSSASKHQQRRLTSSSLKEERGLNALKKEHLEHLDRSVKDNSKITQFYLLSGGMLI